MVWKLSYFCFTKLVIVAWDVPAIVHKCQDIKVLEVLLSALSCFFGDKGFLNLFWGTVKMKCSIHKMHL